MKPINREEFKSRFKEVIGLAHFFEEPDMEKTMFGYSYGDLHVLKFDHKRNRVIPYIRHLSKTGFGAWQYMEPRSLDSIGGIANLEEHFLEDSLILVDDEEDYTEIPMHFIRNNEKGRRDLKCIMQFHKDGSIAARNLHGDMDNASAAKYNDIGVNICERTFYMLVQFTYFSKIAKEEAICAEYGEEYRLFLRQCMTASDPYNFNKR